MLSFGSNRRFVIALRTIAIAITITDTNGFALACNKDMHVDNNDKKTTEIADNGQDHFYTMTAQAEVKKPRVLITFGNEENNRNTRGQFSITKD